MAVEWGQARIEVAALRSEILDHISCGSPVRKIYDELQGDGRITMSRRRFYFYVDRLRSEATQAAKPTQAKSPPCSLATKPPAPAQPASLSPPSSSNPCHLGGLKHDKLPEAADLWGNDADDHETPA